MKATAFFVMTLIFELQKIVLTSEQSTNYFTEITTKPTNVNPLEHLLLNHNGNKQGDGPIVKREAIEQITNPPRHLRSSTESNIEKIPPNNPITDLTSNVKEGRQASVRVKRQFYPYPYDRPYYPIPIIIGGGGFHLGGYRGRGFGYGGRGFGGRGFGGRGFGGGGYGGRGFGGRGFGGRGFGGRGIGGRGIGGRGGIGGGRGGRG